VLRVLLTGTFNMFPPRLRVLARETRKGNVLNGRIINTSSDSGCSATSAGELRRRQGAVALMAIAIDAEMASTRHLQRDCAAGPHPPHHRGDPVDGGAVGSGGEARRVHIFDPQTSRPLVAWLGQRTTRPTCTARSSASAAARCGCCRLAHGRELQQHGTWDPSPWAPRSRLSGQGITRNRVGDGSLRRRTRLSRIQDREWGGAP